MNNLYNISELYMEKLAEKSGLMWDGGDDTRLFPDDEYFIQVHAPTLGYNKYRTMEKEINNFEIKKPKYTVYVWNDSGGWMYWKNEGLSGDTNYIQITAHIKDFNINDQETEELKQDIRKAYETFYYYDNRHEVDWQKYLG